MQMCHAYASPIMKVRIMQNQLQHREQVDKARDRQHQQALQERMRISVSDRELARPKQQLITILEKVVRETVSLKHESVLIYGRDETKIRTVIGSAMRTTMVSKNALETVILKGSNVSTSNFDGFGSFIEAEVEKLIDRRRFMVILENFNSLMIHQFNESRVVHMYREKGIRVCVLCWSIMQDKSEMASTSVNFFKNSVFVPCEPEEQPWFANNNHEADSDEQNENYYETSSTLQKVSINGKADEINPSSKNVLRQAPLHSAINLNSLKSEESKLQETGSTIQLLPSTAARYNKKSQSVKLASIAGYGHHVNAINSWTTRKHSEDEEEEEGCCCCLLDCFASAFIWVFD